MGDRLSLHRSLYRPDAVRTAASAFAALARIDVIEEEAETAVTFDEVDPDLRDSLVDAFANHALAETVRLHRAQRREDLRDETAGLG
jgi:hypothetical protein